MVVVQQFLLCCGDSKSQKLPLKMPLKLPTTKISGRSSILACAIPIRKAVERVVGKGSAKPEQGPQQTRCSRSGVLQLNLAHDHRCAEGSLEGKYTNKDARLTF